MCFERAGYLPACAGEVYGVGVFGFGHGGDGPVLIYVYQIALLLYEAVSDQDWILEADRRKGERLCLLT